MSVVFSIYSFSLVNVICVFHCLISNLFLFENSLDVHSDSRFISIILILYDQKSSNFNLELSVQMKTEIVALVLCLNIGVDPPDVLKVSPCARLECWIDPFSMAPTRALTTIGDALVSQYKQWQLRSNYQIQLDPTVDEVQRFCSTCRRNAGSKRILFHYNGHGVPKPTSNGEIWVFNRGYTQYIPLPIHDLDSWLKAPSVYIFDCHAAAKVITAFMELQDHSSSGSSTSLIQDYILLAACQADESLPQSADFPADLFTSCLTTPIKVSLRWLFSRSLFMDSLSTSLIDELPGSQNDRKTLLGELNWIFTAVTDTIAWNVLPHGN
ncbi:hypothetical protein M9H77_01012 [Catharanthus roseus]|uniref:Uncharacterized protein n=1 Tax=Catharanthus roseus TaxID=4058 RepID=A0ACC0C4H1_CATRO|nr:hypothetical protein M9H77_01012 [Catharanthus roseus]